MILGIPIGLAALMGLIYLATRKAGADPVTPEPDTSDTEPTDPDLPDPNLPPPDEDPEPEPWQPPPPEPANIQYGGGIATYHTGSEDILYSRRFPHEGTGLVCSTFIPAGTKVQAWGTAYNTGGQTGSKNVMAYANGQLKERTVTLDPGQRVWIPFTFTAELPVLVVKFLPGQDMIQVKIQGTEDRYAMD